ncbi:hypothetical protein [Pseudorhodoferax sp.]|uniref:hypothetical protein n=1 Tax=Pseudorhodoferax sp. TaxID=1993553 RepID=UPI002DD6643A|nr:hypothetical protein [Pseudorhodoferax sp.]
MPSAPQVSTEHIAMIRKGVSAIVASRGLDLRPSLMRAMAADIRDDGRLVTALVARAQAGQLLQDIAATGAVSVVFSEPLSHRTVQLKAARAALRPATPADAPLLQRYLASMEQEIGAVGHGPEFVRAMLACRIEALVVIEFAPEQGFDQTPGPRAGAALPPMADVP